MHKDTILSTTFQKFEGDIHKCKPLEFVTLEQFIEGTRHPESPERFEAIAEAARNGDEDLKAKLKKALFSYCVAAIVNGWRAQRFIIRYIGIAVLDYDHMTPEAAKQLKKFLFEHYPCIICAYLSPSGHGFKALVLIPVVQTLEEFRAYFQGITNEFSQYGHFDDHGKNPVQPLFQSYDPDIFFRDDPQTWDIMAPPPEKSKPVRAEDTRSSEPRTLQPKGSYSPAQIESAGKIIKSIADSMFRKITDVGHPNIIRIGRILGGYAGEGLITEEQAITIMEAGISTHPYLKQKESIYLTTARWAIREGELEPLKLITNQFFDRNKAADDFLSK